MSINNYIELDKAIGNIKDTPLGKIIRYGLTQAAEALLKDKLYLKWDLDISYIMLQFLCDYLEGIGITDKNENTFREIQALRDIYEICEKKKCPKCGGNLNPGCSIVVCNECEYEIAVIGKRTINFCNNCSGWKLDECWIKTIKSVRNIIGDKKK